MTPGVDFGHGDIKEQSEGVGERIELFNLEPRQWDINHRICYNLKK